MPPRSLTQTDWSQPMAPTSQRQRVDLLLGHKDGSEVKVGYTVTQTPQARKAQHEKNNGRYEPLVWLAVLLGSKADEGKLKSYFKAQVSREHSDEWIAAGDEMRDYLRSLRDQPYVATTEDVDAESLPQVDSLHWLPGGAHKKSPTQLALPIDGSDPWADLATSVVMEGDFYTHPSIVSAARVAMGSIDLNPASCMEANRVVQATQFFGAKRTELLHSWHGNVWINPPFGSWREEWTPKLISEWQSGRVNQVCALASTRAITAQGFHPIVAHASAVWVGYGRLRFWGPKAGEPDEGHVVFYFGERVAAFAAAFERDGFGTVYLRGASAQDYGQPPASNGDPAVPVVEHR